MAWTVYGLITSQYGDLDDQISVPGGGMVSIKSYIKDYFGFDYDFLGVVGAVLAGFAVFFAFMYALCIRTLNFQNR